MMAKETTELIEIGNSIYNVQIELKEMNRNMVYIVEAINLQTDSICLLADEIKIGNKINLLSKGQKREIVETQNIEYGALEMD